MELLFLKYTVHLSIVSMYLGHIPVLSLASQATFISGCIQILSVSPEPLIFMHGHTTITSHLKP